jgi:hypothetical protein
LDIAADALLSASVRGELGTIVIASSAFLFATASAAVGGVLISIGDPVSVDLGAKSPPMEPLICAEGDCIKAHIAIPAAATNKDFFRDPLICLSLR